MDRSGLVTILLLVLTVVIVMLALKGPDGGIAGLWERSTSLPPDTAAAAAPFERPMTGTDGLQQVDRMQQDMQRMNELMDSVRR
jgi:hypothetical protein